jgi:hypothetical protein
MTAQQLTGLDATAAIRGQIPRRRSSLRQLQVAQEAQGAFAEAILGAGRSELVRRKEGEGMDEDVAFARDIRPLFSDRDVGAMSRFFDLSSYDDVRANAEGIYRRLADGTMPCYGPWPADNVQRFRIWMDNGFAP